ncbi:hypothetical protein [Tychonema sp. LEGE 06208]|uniref:hypothetical protein n=1 Tax=Tychonema sp. LEGE 06208 TaxID=1828663 RepID=UPI001D13ED5F|nr:hypothetical protein [Tychonema sp. LEGE 06208]
MKTNIAIAGIKDLFGSQASRAFLPSVNGVPCLVRDSCCLVEAGVDFCRSPPRYVCWQNKQQPVPMTGR